MPSESGKNKNVPGLVRLHVCFELLCCYCALRKCALATEDRQAASGLAYGSVSRAKADFHISPRHQVLTNRPTYYLILDFSHGIN